MTIHPKKANPGNNSRRAAWLSVLALLCTGIASAHADWPDFRGPWANGYASAPGDTKPLGVPWQWSETNNVKWKTAIPEKGWSTPVESGGQIWLTTATPDGGDYFVICVDANSGAVKLNQKLFHSDHPEPLGNPLNGYASPSPAVEPGRVYVHFGSYGTACLDTSTFKTIWKRNDLPCRHFRGPGSSVFLYKDLVILTMDGIDLQYVVALNKKTGETVWKTDRTAPWNDLNADGKPQGDGDFRKAFSTPYVGEVNGKPLMISAGSKAAYGYDPDTGKEIWKIHYPGFSTATRPLLEKGIAYISSGNGKGEFFAVRADGTGDVTDTHIIWRANRGVPTRPSTIMADGLIFMVSDNCIASCLDQSTGKTVWQERLGGECSASMLYADGRIYIFNQDGKAFVLKAGKTYELLATNKLDDGFMASPAVVGKALILRTRTNLYRIETASAN